MTISLGDLRAAADEYLVPFAIKAVIATAIFVIGRSVARFIVRAVGRVMDRSRMDVSVRKFLGEVIYAGLLVAVVTVALDTLGVKTTAIVAVLGAAGLTIGLALQGSLSNFAAGVMLLVLRPYKVDDQVVIGKYTGRIDAIRVFQTVLITADNREVLIPNGQIISAPIENLTVLGSRRIDIVISVAHGSDLRTVKAALEAVLTSDQRVQTTPAPTIALAEVTEAAMRMYVRPWTSVDNYFAVSLDTLDRINTALDDKGLVFSVALQSQS